jgi:hypothetical protein
MARSQNLHTPLMDQMKRHNQFCNLAAILLAADALGFNFVPTAVSNK